MAKSRPRYARWTPAELARLRRLYPDTPTAAVARALGRSLALIYRKAFDLGLHKSAAFRASPLSGRMRRGDPRRVTWHRTWTAAEVEAVRRRYPHEKTSKLAADLGRPLQHVYAAAKRWGLAKTPAYLASPDACRLRRGDHPGVAYQFKPGQVPANKGLRRPGYVRGRMAETQFKKGQLPQMPDNPEQPNSIDGLRTELFATLRALRDPEKPMSIERAKAIADVGQVIVNSAKAENEFLKITGGRRGTGFIDEKTAPGAPRLVKGTAQP